MTKNGGPADIFSDGAGVLVDPICSNSIANGLLEGLKRHSELSSAAAELVNEKFLWSKTAENYIASIKKIVSNHENRPSVKESLSDFDEEIKTYLRNQFE